MPLIGIFGCTGYFPACVIRQFGAVQNIAPRPSLDSVTLDLLKPDETIKSKLKSIQALWDTRVLKQIIDVGEMEIIEATCSSLQTYYTDQDSQSIELQPILNQHHKYPT